MQVQAVFCRHGVCRGHGRTRQVLVHAQALTRDESVIYTSKELPSRFAAPVTIQPSSTPGSQHVMTTDADLAAGQLVMISKPLGVVYSSPFERPASEELLKQMASKDYTLAEQSFMHALCFPSLQAGEPVPDMSSLNAADQEVIAALPQALSGRLQDIIARHSIVAECQDFASAAVRGEDVHSLLGVWPEVALIPHSCAPTVHEYAIQDSMFVRAGAGVPRGGQVSRNYLGMQAFTPLNVRRELLRSTYGFHCVCPRCTVEDKYPAAQQAVQSAYAAAEALSQEWVAAHDASDVAALADVQRRLRASLAEVDRAVRAADMPYEHELWLQAGTLVAYNLLFSMCTVSGQLEVEVKEAELRFLEALATGTDAHVYTALHHFVQVLMTYGEEGVEVERAEERVTSAHVSRYGLLPRELMLKLYEVRFSDVLPMYQNDESAGSA